MSIDIGQWILVSISTILIVNMSNIGHIRNITLDISQYYKAIILSETSKRETILLIYI